ncbi:glycerophosphodiester phosphodiesterase [Streptomyces sp. AJS327]|uniref:glycerophosphodiester phosphodiesterase n=1 Tax=Streptomyces sp. AJS327 TaxID=2545265 RepID=UPI0015DE340B|nr:glycerophosphodiester phosphodiesterase [Streptomyces sp. AJS327]MBA0050754.1 glycerophosphodiester phosphodiesterase [Streptomyces sp. AJS327]
MGQERQPGRRAVLSAAAVLGAASAGGLAVSGSARAAEPAARRAGGKDAALPVPCVVAHRGASGHRPEHTLGAYQLALDMGADVIEQDLVPTKDGHLVCRHENDITATTDVADHTEFADRKTTKSIDGTELTGWFTEDFTLEELRGLRAKERIPEERQHNTLYDGRWSVPTFQEVLEWAEERGEARGRPVWLHIETKHPTYFRKLGLELEKPLAAALKKFGRHQKKSPNFVQSFEPSSIEKLSGLVKCPGVVLLGALDSRPWDFVDSGDPRTVRDLVTPEGLAEIARYARGIGPLLDLVIPRDADGRLGEPTSLVRDAHAKDLVLHPYTMRNENTFLPTDYRRGTEPGDYGDAFGVLKAFFETGIDGIFADQPDTALLAAADFRARG